MSEFRKLSFKNFISLLIIPIMLGAAACSNSSSSPSEIPQLSLPFSYEFITENRTFIGGSLIYDPNSSSGLTQISAGAKFGVRLGKLREKTESVNSYNSGYSEIESLSSNDSVTGETDDPNATVTAITSLSGGTSKTKTVYEDIPEKAVYGYISIISANADSISFLFTTVTPAGAAATKSFTLNKGESCDLDGSGIKNLKYDEPSLRRTPYSENARWLTFLNEEKTLTSNMFCKFNTSEILAGYRVAQNVSSSADKGLYAVNSNNDFVYVYYDDNYVTDDSMAYGDYIVCLPSTVGISEGNIEWGNIYDNPAENNESTSENEFYKSVAGLSTSDSMMNFGGKTYIVTNGSTSAVTLKDKNEFANYSIVYEYELWHFPDETNGPRDLLNDLNAYADLKTLINLSESSSPSDIIARLNELLPQENFFNAVLDSKVSDAQRKSDAQTAYATAGSDTTERKKFCRLLLDELYSSSPDTFIQGPDLTGVYPDMVLNLGSPVELAEHMYSGQRNVYIDDVDVGLSKTIHSKYEDYKKRHDELEKEWKRFFTIDISQVVLYPSDKDKKKKFTPKSAGVYLGAGVRASASITSGRADFEMAMAFWLDLDLNMQSLNAILDYTLNPALAQKMEGPNISLAEKLAAVFGSKVKRIEVKLNDVNINVAGVPLVFGVTAKTGINFKLDGAFDPRICFSGMYGGEVKLGASYGFEWFAKPYFKPYANGKGINNTDFYIGLGTRGAANTKITFEPWFCLTPSFGLGTSTISVRGSVPTKFGLHTVMSVPPIKMDEAGVFISVYFTPYFEADLKFVKIRKDFITLKPLDHDILFYPKFETRRRK